MKIYILSIASNSGNAVIYIVDTTITKYYAEWLSNYRPTGPYAFATMLPVGVYVENGKFIDINVNFDIIFQSQDKKEFDNYIVEYMSVEKL